MAPSTKVLHPPLWEQDQCSGPSKPASFPTAAPHGTEERIRVMQERLARHEELRHPGDAGLAG